MSEPVQAKMYSGQAGSEDSGGEQNRFTRGLGSFLGGLVAAALVVLTLLVAVILGTQEQSLVASTGSTETSTAVPATATSAPLPTTVMPSPSVAASPTPPATALPPSATTLPSPTLTPTPTETPRPTAASGCWRPDDWLPYKVQRGETVEMLARLYGTLPALVRRYNCLENETLHANQMIYLLCGKEPPNWVEYTVRSGDTLSGLASYYDVYLWQLKLVNCVEGDKILIGETLWVRPRAPVPTSTPRPATATPLPPTASPTLTATLTPTASSTPGPTGAITGTVTLEPTDGTPEPGPTTPTDTPGPTAGPTDTPGPTETPTDLPMPTDTPTPTETPSNTPAPTDTSAPTNTPVPPTMPPTDTSTPAATEES